jgi:hypothetical protein
MKNFWEPILNYEKFYLANQNGQIKGIIKNKVLKGSFGSTGYKHIVLSKNGKYKTKDVHRIVAETFIPNPFNLKYVNHIDGNKANNSVNNLEWVTARENTKHATLLGLKKDSGSNSKNSKLKERDIYEIRKLSKSKSKTNKEISSLYNINKDYVSMIINKKRWTHI